MSVNDYFVRSERLGFRVWTVDDLELALGLWGDPDVTPHIGGPFSHDQVRARLETFKFNKRAELFVGAHNETAFRRRDAASTMKIARAFIQLFAILWWDWLHT